MGNPRGFYTLYKREVLRFLSLPFQTVLPTVISIVLYIAIFGKFLGPRVKPIDGFPYIMYIFPGLLMLGVGTSAFNNASTSLFISRWEHFIDDLLVAPISYTEMVFAYMLASLTRGIITGAAILPLGLMFLPLHIERPILLALSIVLSTFAFSTSGLVVGLWAKRWDNLAVVQTFGIMPLTFLGGVFYSMSMLPDSFRAINELNPVYYMVSAVRHGFLGHADAAVGLSFLITTLFGGFFFAWAFLLFRRGYNLRR